MYATRSDCGQHREEERNGPLRLDSRTSWRRRGSRSPRRHGVERAGEQLPDRRDDRLGEHDEERREMQGEAQRRRRRLAVEPRTTRNSGFPFSIENTGWLTPKPHSAARCAKRHGYEGGRSCRLVQQVSSRAPGRSRASDSRRRRERREVVRGHLRARARVEDEPVARARARLPRRRAVGEARLDRRREPAISCSRTTGRSRTDASSNGRMPISCQSGFTVFCGVST